MAAQHAERKIRECTLTCIRDADGRSGGERSPLTGRPGKTRSVFGCKRTHTIHITVVPFTHVQLSTLRHAPVIGGSLACKAGHRRNAMPVVSTTCARRSHRIQGTGLWPLNLFAHDRSRPSARKRQRTQPSHETKAPAQLIPTKPSSDQATRRPGPFSSTGRALATAGAGARE